jgi:hypothetical protein
VAGKFFEDCVLYGPGVIFLSQPAEKLNRLEYCSFGGDIESMRYDISPKIRMLIGLIAFENCRFLRCKFVGLGIAGPSEFFEHMARVVPQKSF